MNRRYYYWALLIFLWSYFCCEKFCAQPYYDAYDEYPNFYSETRNQTCNKKGVMIWNNQFMERVPIPQVFDQISVVNNLQTHKRVVIGRIDTAWYEVSLPFSLKAIDFKKDGIKGIRYMGGGMFSIQLNGKLAIYRYYDKKIVQENFDVLDGGFGFQSDDVLYPIGYKNKIPYRLMFNDSLCYSAYSLQVKEKNSKFGIDLLLEDGITQQVLDFTFDKIDLSCSDYICAIKGKNYLLLDYNLKERYILDTFPDRLSFPNPMIRNNYIIKSNGKYGLMSDQLQLLLPIEYDYISCGGRMIYAEKNKLSYYWNTDMKLIASLPQTQYTAIKDNYYLNYYNDLAYWNNAVFGLMNDSNRKVNFFVNYNLGKCITDSVLPIYYPLYNYSNRNAYVTKRGVKCGLVDIDGKQLLPLENDSIYHFVTSYYSLSEYLKGKYPFKKNGKFGFMDIDFKVIMPPQFDSISFGKTKYSGRRKDDSPLVLLCKNGNCELYNLLTLKSTGITCDSIVRNTDVHKAHWSETRVFFRGQSFLVDSVGKMYIDYKNVRVRALKQGVVLEDTVKNKAPNNILPGVSISKCVEINKVQNYAVIFCLNRYFVVNQYGELSLGFEEYPELIDIEHQFIFGKKLKKQKTPGLYNFKGIEINKLSKNKEVYAETDEITNEVYYVFVSNKNMKGLANAFGEVLVEPDFYEINTIVNGTCELTRSKGQVPELFNIKKRYIQIKFGR